MNRTLNIGSRVRSYAAARSFLQTLVTGLFLLATASCSGSDAERRQVVSTVGGIEEGLGPDAFAQPDTLLRLPGRLREISGLIVLPSGILLAVQDEDGDLFPIDPETGDVGRRIRFGGSGDYEGLSWSDGRVLILRSDGDIRSLTWPEGLEHRLMERDDDLDVDFQATRYEADLPKNCDAEGIAVFPGGSTASSERWLVACKEWEGSSSAPGRGLYAVVPTRAENGTREKLETERAFLLPRPRMPGGRVLPLQRFKLSGLTILADGSFLMLSSTAPALFHYGSGGELMNAWALPKRLLPQPEAVAVAPDGTVFIATEGGSGSAAVAIYRQAARDFFKAPQP